VQALLLELSDTAEGRAALTTMGVERFVLIDDARYDSVRDLLNVIGSSPP
jgi:hypothetical protein